MKMFRFIFQQNRTINEEFDFDWFKGTKKEEGVRGAPIFKNDKVYNRTVVPTHTDRKFQHSS